jgi:hypothetical protein
MSLKSLRYSLSVLFAYAVFVVAVAAATKPAINVSRGQLALRGYDAVSYSVDGKAVRGLPAFEYRWMNAVVAIRERRFISPGSRKSRSTLRRNLADTARMR